MRWRVLKTLMVLICLPALLLAQDAQEQRDRGIIQAFLEDALSNAGREVRIEGFDGALSSRATIAEMTIVDADGVWLTLRGAALDWNRSALLRGSVEVQELTAEELIIARPPRTEDDGAPAPEATPLSIPSLPVSIRIDRLDIDRLELGAPVLGVAAVLRMTGAASLAGGGAQADLDVTRIDGQRGRFALAGSFDPDTEQLAIDLTLSEAADGIAANLLDLPGRPSVDLSVAGTGPADDYTAAVRLATDGETRLSGTVTSRLPDARSPREFAVDLGGDLRPVVQPQFRDFLGSDQRLVASGSRAADGALTLDTLTLRSDELQLTGALTTNAQGWPTQLSLTGVIAPSGGAEVLLTLPGEETRVRRVDLAVSYDAAQDDAWTLNLSVEGLRRGDVALDAGTISGRGTLSPQARTVAGAVSVDLSGLDLPTEDLNTAVGPRVTGRLSFDAGADRDLTLTDMQLSGDGYSLTGDATVAGIAGQLDLAISGTVALVADDLSRFAALTGTDLTGAANVEIKGTVLPISGGFDLAIVGSTLDLAIGNAQIDPLIAGTSQLALTAQRGADGLKLTELTIDADGVDIAASGTVASARSDLDFALTLPDVTRVLPRVPGAARLTGTAQQRGDTWTVETNVTGPGALVAAAELKARQADGAFGPFDAKADVKLGSLAVFEPLTGTPLRGALAVEITSAGDLRTLDHRTVIDGTGRNLAIGNDLADKLLRGGATLTGAITGTGAVQTIERLSVATAAVSATVTGTLGDGAQRISFDTTLADLGSVVDGLSGAARGVGTASRIGEVLTLDATLTGPGTAAITLDATTQMTDTGAGPFTAKLDGTVADLSPYSGAAKRSLGGALSLGAQASGDLRDQTVTITADATGDDLRAGIAQADRLLAGRSTLTLVVQRAAGGVVTVETFDLSNPQVTAELSGRTGPAQTAITYALGLRDTGLLVPGLNGPSTARGTAQSDGGPVAINADLTGPGGIGATVAGSVARDASTLNLSANGTAPLALANIAIAPALADGLARFDLRIDGPPALSSLSGSVTTSGAQLALPQIGNSLQGITLNVQLGGGSARIDTTGQLATGGRIAVDGSVALSAPFTGDLRAQLASLTITDPGLYETTLDGALTINGPLAGGARIAGRIDLGPTELRVPSGAGQIKGALPNLVHVNEPADVRRTRRFAGLLDNGKGGFGAGGPAYGLDILISAPNRIFVRGRGLDAELGGQLRLGGTTADIVPSGRFTLVRGRLDLLGKRINLVEASMRLQGNFDPYIRLVGETASADARIVITIEGLATAPELQLTSIPEKPSDEVLAQLLFGKNLTEISPLQALQMANAVRTLAGQSGEGLVGQLRSGFGFDDLDFTTSESGAAGVRAGKYLNENLYSDVSVDSEGNTEVNLNLQLTPSLTARGTVGSTGKTGIGIHFERDY